MQKDKVSVTIRITQNDNDKLEQIASQAGISKVKLLEKISSGYADDPHLANIYSIASASPTLAPKLAFIRAQIELIKKYGKDIDPATIEQWRATMYALNADFSRAFSEHMEKAFS